MKLLWFNADDFGLSDGVCRGIVEAIHRGPVGTTSAMVAREGALETIHRYAVEIPGRIGLHLQLTDGKPRLPPGEIPSLVGPGGLFPHRRKGLGRPDPTQVACEWGAQLIALQEIGIKPTHIDSHHHVHVVPGMLDVYIDFAKKHHLPARGGSPRIRNLLRNAGVRTCDSFSARFFGDSADRDGLLEVLDRARAELPDSGTLEVMCHPGRPDAALAQASNYVEQRLRELDVLCQSDLLPQIHALDYKIVDGPHAGSMAGG